MGNNCHAVAVSLLKYQKTNNQPAQAELAAVQQVVTAITKRSAAWWHCGNCHATLLRQTAASTKFGSGGKK